MRGDVARWWQRAREWRMRRIERRWQRLALRSEGYWKRTSEQLDEEIRQKNVEIQRLQNQLQIAELDREHLLSIVARERERIAYEAAHFMRLAPMAASRDGF